MEGYHAQANVEERGIIPRAIEQIFGFIAEHASPRMRFLVRASYLQARKTRARMITSFEAFRERSLAVAASFNRGGGGLCCLVRFTTSRSAIC